MCLPFYFTFQHLLAIFAFSSSWKKSNFATRKNRVKDYYYFLGIEASSSDEEIKKAYRKLSLKYHPDKNPGDDFFAHRFREIQEAYEMLSVPDKRRMYDENFAHQQRTFRPTLPPSIIHFSASTVRASKGEEVILTWQTQNADVVKVLPFGLEKQSGERIFRIKEFKEGKFQLLLHATNTLLNKTVVQGITISEMAIAQKENQSQEQPLRHQPPRRPNPFVVETPRNIRVLLAVIFLVLAAIIVISNFFSS